MSYRGCKTVGEGAICIGSEALMLRFGDMDSIPVVRNVGGSEELCFSPPTSEAPIGSSSNDSGESSEEWEDHTSCLAEEIAQSMLMDDDEISVRKSSRSMAGPKPAGRSSQVACSPISPQSTLAGVGGYNWEGLHPDGTSSGLSSPPTPVTVASSTPADVGGVDGLYAELVRFKLEREMKFRGHKQGLGRSGQIFSRRQTAVSVADNISHVMGRRGPATNDLCQQGIAHGRPAGGEWGPKIGNGSSRHYRAVADSVLNGYAAWDAPGQQYPELSAGGDRIHDSSSSLRSGSCSVDPTIMQSPIVKGGSGMRAVFLSGSRERGGTGVFLPRRLGSVQDSKRKPACSTVLLPSRVVHALNLNVEDTLPSPLRRDQSYWPRTSSPPESPDSEEIGAVPLSSSLQEIAPDIRLPSEWTY